MMPELSLSSLLPKRKGTHRRRDQYPETFIDFALGVAALPAAPERAVDGGITKDDQTAPETALINAHVIGMSHRRWFPPS